MLLDVASRGECVLRAAVFLGRQADGLAELAREGALVRVAALQGDLGHGAARLAQVLEGGLDACLLQELASRQLEDAPDALFVQLIKLAQQEVGLGNERVRGPRLTLAGAEREAALDTIRTVLANRPKL